MPVLQWGLRRNKKYCYDQLSYHLLVHSATVHNLRSVQYFSKIHLLVVALVSLSTPVEHFICFVEHQHLDVIGDQMTLPWRGMKQHHLPGIDLWLWFEIGAPFWERKFCFPGLNRFLNVLRF